ncbi:MAG: metal-sulfur cluster assembly factor [Candidatus Parvarchaeota archaeon]|nr:metal-sulfur cluster assembly factor [Candidatus Jingweiarchaeum tengchongense]MCW1298362.1 metal-sulfur cluster assembly factor [Candidatus Jingweiarchaeum tengchongense]MCW1300336.1 metal-sulfur cluster assembly factor [Candidatus Jingweiarchaeum tengchongense]MCW1304867.1 metal-sulfur cluster assembly factor [Candidatus Jingweiarchaeum tengchongense]MCW1305832.1 metal-sulfur cluster assembly factor [Candidatus Jingweiarchaeum tengchongense]
MPSEKKSISKKDVISALRNVIDPEIGIDIVTMKMIKKIEIKDGNVKVMFVPTTPFCPLINNLVFMIRQEVEKIKGVKKCDVQVTIK